MGSCLGSCATAAAAPAHSACTSTSDSTTHSTSSTSSSLTTPPTSWVANSWLWRKNRSTGRQDPEAELLSRTTRQRCQRGGFIYRILRLKRRQQCPSFLDKYWEQQPSYAKLPTTAMADIQMQNLDAGKLLNAQTTPSRETEMGLGAYQRMANSRASSSLDLEWEHEYSQLRQYQFQCQQVPKELPPTPPKPRYASLDQLAAANAMATSQGRHMARQARLSCQRHGGSLTRNSCCSSTQNSWSHISTPESLEWDVDEEREQQRQLRQEDDNLDDRTLKLLHQIEQLKHHVLQETGDGLSMESAAVEELTEGLQFRATHFAGDSQLEAHVS
ncbi:uncharacterized protein LOC117141335 isoform X2 [Drosophila mauritiana]|uniref:Uncharacterized protein LOC117141335 isoform X2 n=1 Tax=Drosophila mauritiana TaxID=7226 RepID=A0A6P8JWH0_DROMA|nr:uncharacterized protein LOC117141335 isoform X2 [Drosophila mauritiana]